MTLKGKRVEEPFIGLPEGDWMWSTVRENLNNLATASGKDTAHILKALHKTQTGSRQTGRAAPNS